MRSAAADHLIDQAHAIGLLRRDHLAAQDELQGAALADQTRQALGSAAARNESQGDFGLAELRALDGDPDRAGHRGLAAAAQGKAIDGRHHRLAEILDEIEHLLPETAGLFGLESGQVCELADIGAGDEGLVAGTRQDDAADRRIIACILEGLAQVRPGRRIQRVEDFRAIDGDVGDAVLDRVEDVRERRARFFGSHCRVSC